MATRFAPGGATGARTVGGFTLIEVIVALVIIGIMAAATVPAFLGENRHTDLEAAAAKLEALLRIARDSAVLTGGEVLVTVDSASGAVWFEARSRSSGPPMGFEMDGGASTRSMRVLGSPSLSTGSLGSTAPPSPGREVAIDLPPTVRIELGRARASFLFTAGGAVIGDTIVLRSSSGPMVAIHLDPWSGRAGPR